LKIRSLDGKTPDIAEENIQKLRQIFPDVFTEDKVNFEKLQQVLGNYVEDSNERYNFTWNGKGRALRLSQTPSLGTLRPCKEESKDWDTTQNLYIEGDNLEVLKLLQKSYHNKVKMIYIDPPYNTGGDFVYPDDFHDSLENYKKLTGQVDSEGNKLSTNTEASGRYHTDWLNMMYPRLRLARNLLTDDGVIFISIDDNEVDNLKKICNEIFGEDNFIAQLTIETGEVFGTKAAHVNKTFVKVKDYVLAYAKNNQIEKIRIPLYDSMNEYFDTHYSTYISDDLERRSLIDHLREVGWVVNLFNSYKIELSLNNINKMMNIDESFRKYINYDLSKNIYTNQPFTTKIPDNIEEQLQENNIVFYNGNLLYETKTGSIRYYQSFDECLHLTDNYISDYTRAVARGDLWKGFHYDMRNINDEGEIEFNNGKKPVRLILQLAKWLNLNSNDIILDFFSGSSTTAHSIMQYNVENNVNCKYMMVQLPENLDVLIEKADSSAKRDIKSTIDFLDSIEKSHFITEVGKERIRRAGEKIKKENKDKKNIANLDIGFKVLKLDTSNIRKWQPDYDNLEQSLEDFIDNYVEGRTELDVVYEIMLKYGLDLTYPVDEFTVAQKKVYSIGFGMLMICLDNEITTEVAKGILEKVKELAPESTRVVFKDNGFKTDSNKTNIKEILKSGGIEEFITI